jgi:hypothetical protein
MAKETLYFSHAGNARSDRKIMNLRMKYGMEGVGVYWCIVEMLYENGGYLPLEYERITFELRITENVLRDVINAFDLFKIDGEKFYSESVLERLAIRMEKSEKARQSISYRWAKNGDTNVLRPKAKRNTKKKRKEKKRKDITATKIAYHNNVFLTEKEVENLVSDFGKELFERAALFLSSYKIEKDYKTKDDNLTIRRWVIDAVQKNGIVGIVSNDTAYDKKVAQLKAKQLQEKKNGTVRVHSEQGNPVQITVGADSF